VFLVADVELLVGGEVNRVNFTELEGETTLTVDPQNTLFFNPSCCQWLWLETLSLAQVASDIIILESLSIQDFQTLH